MRKYSFPVVGRGARILRARLRRYKRLSHDLPIFGESDLSFFHYRRNTKVETELIPATWTQVLLLAFCYAMIINLIKVAVYDITGRPEFRFSDDKLESRYQQLVASERKW
jgi:hypothetical protein